MKTQIVPQRAIRMQKKLYILKPYTKLSLPKKILTARCLRRKFEGVGGSEQSMINSCMNINVIKIIIFPNICLKSNTNTTLTYLKIKYLSTNQYVQ